MIRIFNIKKIISVGLVSCLMLIFATMPVNAAAIIDIEMPAEIKKGETYTVNITFVDNNIGEIKGQVEYDSTKIEYISGGSSEGNTGLVLLNGNGYGNSKAIFNIKFKGIEAGEGILKVTTAEIYNLDGENLGSPTKEVNYVVVNEEGTSEGSQEPSESEGNADASGGESSEVAPVISKANSFFSSPESVYIVGLVILVVLLSITLIIINIRKRKKIKKLKELDVEDQKKLARKEFLEDGAEEKPLEEDAK